MSGILALLVGTAAVGLHGHRPLMWLANRRIDPTIVLTGWLLTCVGLVASALATISLLALPADKHHSSGIFRLAGGCWTAISSGSAPRWREVLGALSVLGAIAILVRLAWAVNGRIRRGRAQAPHVAQLRLLAGGAGPEEPLWVQDDRPLAMSIGGRPGLIVMSNGLRDRLPPAALAAALEHERAHLRGRHHTLIAVADVLATGLPLCPLLRAAPNAIKDLVELAADAQAARRCGPDAVHEALSRLTGQAAPALGLGMAGRLTQARLARLATAKPAGRRALRLMGCVAISVGALMLPAAAGWLALNMLGCVVT